MTTRFISILLLVAGLLTSLSTFADRPQSRLALMFQSMELNPEGIDYTRLTPEQRQVMLMMAVTYDSVVLADRLLANSADVNRHTGGTTPLAGAAPGWSGARKRAL